MSKKSAFEDKGAARRAPPIKKLIVAWDHTKDGDDELSVRAGETLEGLEKIDEWWLARRLKKRADDAVEVGLIPANYVAEVGDPDDFVFVFRRERDPLAGCVLGLDPEDIRIAASTQPIPRGMPEAAVAEAEDALRSYLLLEKDRLRRRSISRRWAILFGAITFAVFLAVVISVGVLFGRGDSNWGTGVLIVGGLAVLTGLVYLWRVVYHDEDTFDERLALTVESLVTSVARRNQLWEAQKLSRGWSGTLYGIRHDATHLGLRNLHFAIAILPSISSRKTHNAFSVSNPLSSKVY